MGFEDETWFSRFERPSLHSSWAGATKPVRLLEKEARKDDPEPKALACYGMYLPGLKESWLRFVDGRPVSAITARVLGYCCDKLAAAGKEALLLIWDNASWHKSREVRGWITAHNRHVKEKQPWSTDSYLLSAHQESVAERHRTQMGTRQAQSDRARESAWRLRVC